ncbi:PQQ-binding-like beta-propeller repeat protein [Micromonospora sp. WMMD961]|uniref:outer membrane protein assembly factor BamB family protein n=1 Tax=Micromonospora sp. WMMD961 TaxID=3016100 RepID=UPI002417B529|nr:PQQ-binding-like beta-propeller repeat protein [Micromonospora sp. WMMD961]MDG4781434.1 PQQ-binding-like beta-propeller repeat protein [Micromonospora sp. WMMD961]
MSVLIELGEDRGAPLDERRPPPQVSRRWWLAWLVTACALLGGAAPTGRLTPQVELAVPARATVLGAGPLLLVVDPDSNPPTLSAYDPAAPDGPPRWRVTVPPAAGWYAEVAGDLLLLVERDQVRGARATTARSMRTGQPLWRRPERVYAAGDAAVAVSEVRSASEPGRRVEGTVHGVDPATGATRWSIPLPSTAVLRALPGRVLLLVQDDGLARLLDARDGAERGRGHLPPADYGPDNPQVVGAHLVLRHPSGEAVALTGYDLPGLAPRWRVPVPPGELTLRPCQGLICGQGEDGRWAIDAGTGARAWSWPAGARWRTVAGPRVPAEPLVVLGMAADGRRSLVATVGRDGHRVSAVLPAGVTDCRRAGTGLLCRDGAARQTFWPLDVP